jgi:hypothetical protein
MMRLALIIAVVCAPAVAWAAKGAPTADKFAEVLSPSEDIRTAAIARLRERGRPALEELLAVRDALIQRRDAAADQPESWQNLNEQLTLLEAAIDGVGAQRYCSASRLFWHTDLAAAQAEAQNTGKPILSLRMLGLLTDEFSCANSRFFRTTLYANEEISKSLREKFVLHWQSVRPVPRITVDFGDGRKIERTITGNSAHYVLTPEGRPIDALPGLYGPAAFLGWLKRAAHVSAMLAETADHEADAVLQAYHSRRLRQIAECWRADVAKAGLDASLTPDALDDDDAWRQIAALHGEQATLDAASVQLIRAQNPNAAQAMRRAVTKALVEDPLLRLVNNLQSSISLDSVKNEYQLHRRIHAAFLEQPELAWSVDPLNEWVYAELFLTPSADPWMGLAPGDTYTALPDGGIVVNGAE